MSESTNGTSITLADRLRDAKRSLNDRDLQLVTEHLYETLGRWFELGPDGNPPSVDASDIVVRVHPAGDEAPETDSALLDAGDRLEPRPPGNERESDEYEAGEDEESDRDEAGEPSPDFDERDLVFTASGALAQVALGRQRADDESWDDVIQALEADERPALASALWVGLATEPKARYRTIGQWRRAVDAAIRSDAATATMLNGDGEPRRTRPILAMAALAVAVGGGMFLLLRGGDTDVDDAGTTTTEATTSAADGGPTTSTSESPTEEAIDPEAAVDGDECSLVGDLGPITIDQRSDTAIVVAWAPSLATVNILLDGVFVDTVPPEAFRYVIERLPLTDQPLQANTDYTVIVEPRIGDPSSACATTLAESPPGGEQLIGVTAPTGLEVIDATATSITVGWDPRPGADSHNLYLDGSYIQFGDVGGSSAIGDEVEFTFIDLEPGTTYRIGIRRIEGPNQSGEVSIQASTEAR